MVTVDGGKFGSHAGKAVVYVQNHLPVELVARQACVRDEDGPAERVLLRATGGGLWKSTDGGTEPRADPDDRQDPARPGRTSSGRLLALVAGSVGVAGIPASARTHRINARPIPVSGFNRCADSSSRFSAHPTRRTARSRHPAWEADSPRQGLAPAARRQSGNSRVELLPWVVGPQVSLDVGSKHRTTKIARHFPSIDHTLRRFAGSSSAGGATAQY
jgi:hypothetical protein